MKRRKKRAQRRAAEIAVLLILAAVAAGSALLYYGVFYPPHSPQQFPQQDNSPIDSSGNVSVSQTAPPAGPPETEPPVTEPPASEPVTQPAIEPAPEPIAEPQETGHKITYYFTPVDSAGRDRNEGLAKQAFSTWENATNRTVYFEQVDSPEEADITFTWYIHYYDLLVAWMSLQPQGAPVPTNEILGFAYGKLPDGQKAHIDLLLSRGECGYTPIIEVHEIGHVLGLGHSALSNTAMYPFEGYCFSQITEDSIEEIKELWGS